MRIHVAAVLVWSWLVSCGGGGGGGPGGDDGDDDPILPRATKIFAATLNPNLDLLFVIDNSGSMGEEQANLTANFPELMNVLSTIEGGMPSVHIGVVSSNVGSGATLIGGCSSTSQPNGDDGNLQTNACAGLTEPFLSDLGLPDGSRQRNYTGELADVFTCMGQLGTSGCGFEQHLESMYRALQPEKNPGFLRPEARLGVIIIGDEDDCSALPGGALFGEPDATIDSPLGPRTSFRCFEFGVACAGDTMPRAFGTRTGCVPRAGSPYNQPIERYVDFLRTLKPHADDVAVAGIIGSVDSARTAVVGDDFGDPTRPALHSSCISFAGIAFPGFRLQSFLEGFPDRHHSTSICSGDLSEAMIGIATQLKQTMGVPCMGLDLADADAAQPGVQPTCTVTEFEEHGTARTDLVTIPSCAGAPAPCWRIEPAPQACPSTPGNLRLEIDRLGGVAAPDAFIEATCVIN